MHQHRYIIIPYEDTRFTLTPYTEVLGDIAGIAEEELVNEVLSMFHETSGRICLVLLSNASQRIVTNALLGNRIVDVEDYDALAEATYEALEYLTDHLTRVLNYIHRYDRLRAIGWHGDDLILSA